MPTKVLVADDSGIIRTAILRMLSDVPGLEVVGEAGNYAEAVELTNALKPDVLLLDLHMPDENEFPPEIIRSKIPPHEVCILVISLRNDEQAKAIAAGLGAKIFLDKTTLYATLIPALKEHCMKSSQAKI